MTRPFAVLTVVCVGLWPSIAQAQTNPAVVRCSPYISNRDCTVTIDANSPTTPLPLKMKDGAKLTVVVKKRPLQTIEIAEASKEVEALDTTRAVAAAALPGLGSVVDRIRATSDYRTMTESLKSFGSTARPGVPTVDPIITRLKWVVTQHLSSRTSLDNTTAAIKAANTRVGEFDGRPSSYWSPASFDDGKTALASSLAAIASTGLPSGQIAATEAAIKEIIEVHVTRTTPPSADTDAEIAKLLDQVTAEQDALTAELTKATADAALLERLAVAIAKLNYSEAYAFTTTIVQGDDKEPRSADISISRTDRTTGKSKDLVKVTGAWATSRFETSTGLLFSDVRVRTFGAAPRWANGSPVLVNNTTDVNQFVHETEARPMVVPFALIHFNVYEAAVRGGRVAVFGTGGIGVNPHSRFADFAYGGSLGYRSVYLSLLKHRTRDLRLSGGLVTGQSLGSKPPAILTDRFWVTDWSVALTLRVF